MKQQTLSHSSKLVVSSYTNCKKTVRNPHIYVYFFLAEDGILRDTDRTEQSIKHGDAAGVVSNTSSIARRANRVLQVAQQEADNSEDPRFVDRVNESVRELRNSETL